MLEDIEIIDAVRANGLDGHILSANMPLVSVGYPPCGGRTAMVSMEATAGNQVLLRQKTKPGEDFLKPKYTSVTEQGIAQRGVENLKRDEVRNVREV